MTFAFMVMIFLGIVFAGSLFTFGSDHPAFDEKELNRMLAECHSKTGNPDEAAKAYAVILKGDPGDVDACARLGMIERGRAAGTR